MIMHFPIVRGTNLSGREYILPAGFEGELNIVALAFQMWHQNEVDTWIPLLTQLEQQVTGLRAYELPVIRSMNRLSQWMIDQGMRGGIPDLATRARTITLYIDKEGFRKQLGLPNENHIYVLLVDRGGQVLWRCQGAYRPDTAQELVETVKAAKIAVA
jgi:hypothetical protein